MVITVEMHGETKDLQNDWHELYRFLSERFKNVDFEFRKGKITFLCQREDK